MNVPETVRVELQRRLGVRAAAEAAVLDYVRGAMDALEIDFTTVAGIDDVTGEILIRAEAEPAPED